MKRIKAACIEQILEFIVVPEEDAALAKSKVVEELKLYKARLEHAGTQHKILEETTLPDGSIRIHIKKQYNNAAVGTLLD